LQRYCTENRGKIIPKRKLDRIFFEVQPPPAQWSRRGTTESMHVKKIQNFKNSLSNRLAKAKISEIKNLMHVTLYSKVLGKEEG
jgi:hypothetical protein